VAINFTDYLFEIGQYNDSTDDLILAGSYSIDLTSFRDSIIDLAFGFEAGYDDFYLDSFGTFSSLEINLADTGGNTAPVPEPATMILLGSGLIGLAGASRKKRLKNLA
jgi:hypothetical protein